MKTFKNANFTKRNYECTNVVACVAAEAPNDGITWIETSEVEVSGLDRIFIRAGIQYYGYL